MKSKVIEAMEAVPSGNLMSLGKELKKRGVEYDFMLTDFMPAHYFCLDSNRFDSWSDLFDAVYDEAYNRSPDNVPSYFMLERDAQTAIDEWSAALEE